MKTVSLKHMHHFVMLHIIYANLNVHDALWNVYLDQDYHIEDIAVNNIFQQYLDIEKLRKF